ncbi:MAG TPA: anaerobic glycerol-3-phosphate dehydrogenase subunit GlpA [Candidatus Limnocylindrales bacterium]|nr:anaerobic glycerol-3-phosphate dehydrogenase subunit GlpA [Candidatus Limnocylindrales bacterium]
MTATFDVLVIGGGATGAGLLRDLSRRGLHCLLVEKGDLGSGTSGRYHGLLHSGGRYVAKDPSAARECIAENRILRRIAPACIEDTGGWFVATPHDPDDYVDGFAAACAATGVDCEERPAAELLRREPALHPGIRRAFRVPDATLEPWQLIEANLADARAHGAEAWPYRRLVGFDRRGDRLLAARIADAQGGEEQVSAACFVSATGAWAGGVAALAGAEVKMSPGKGTMLVFNERMTDTVVNRCHRPGDGDIMCPVHTVAILGTTDILVDDPDHFEITSAEVVELLAEGEKLFPGLSRRRLLRAYGGVRPLYKPPEPPEPSEAAGSVGAGGAAGAGSGGGDRAISRSHYVIDHAAADGIAGFVSIVGGKLTTYRLMAEQTADLVCRKLGLAEASTTAREVLPDQGDRRHYWLGDRLAEHEADGGGDADLICECEFVTRAGLERFLDQRWPCSLDDVRRGTRLGMGPCQGGFCTFRAAGIVAQRLATGRDAAGSGEGGIAAAADAATVGFLRERYKGGRPIAWGRQLQELWMTSGLYWGTLGVAGIPGPSRTSPDGRGTRAAR